MWLRTLLILAMGTFLVFALVVAYRTARDARERLERALRLGQYTLEEKIGEGGMGVAAVVDLHLTERPSPPSAYQSELSAAFDAWVLRCLEKSPDRRFSSAREALEALRAIHTERWSEETTAAWWESAELDPPQLTLEERVAETLDAAELAHTLEAT